MTHHRKDVQKMQMRHTKSCMGITQNNIEGQKHKNNIRSVVSNTKIGRACNNIFQAQKK